MVYLATAEGLDPEMKDRIEKHRQVRQNTGIPWKSPGGLGDALHSSGLEPDLVLLDCVTLLVSNLMLDAGDRKSSQTRTGLSRRLRRRWLP